MGTTGPYLAAADRPAPLNLLRRRTHGGEVRSRLRLAHPQAEDVLGADDTRQQLLLQLVAAVTQNRRADLPIGDPVGGYRRFSPQELLGDNQTRPRVQAAAAEFHRPRDTDEPLRGELAGELEIIGAQPAIAARGVAARGKPRTGQLPPLLAQRTEPLSRIGIGT